MGPQQAGQAPRDEGTGACQAAFAAAVFSCAAWLGATGTKSPLTPRPVQPGVKGPHVSGRVGMDVLWLTKALDAALFWFVSPWQDFAWAPPACLQARFSRPRQWCAMF